MAIVRVDPFREFANLQNRLFGNVYLRGTANPGPAAWVPRVDIFETEQHDLIVKAELPDMNREDIEVTVEDGTLTLKGTKKPAGEVKDEQYRRMECQYGSFSRSFSLPTSVDASKVSAEYKNGVLTVKLPFREESKPRSINVEVAA